MRAALVSRKIAESSHGRGTRLSLALGLLLVVNRPLPASAQADGTPAESRQEVSHSSLGVFVYFVGPQQAEELDARIASWFLGRIGAYSSSRLEKLEPSLLFGERAPGVHVFVTRLSPRLLRIFFVCKDASTQRYLVRDLPFQETDQEVALENTAQVVFSASLALWDGRETMSRDRVAAEMMKTEETAGGVYPTQEHGESTLAPVKLALPTAIRLRDEASASGARAQPKAAQGRGLAWSSRRLVTAGGYSVRYRGPEGVAHGPTLGLGMVFGDRRQAGVVLSATLLLPVIVEERELALELRGYTLALSPWLELWRVNSTRFSAALAAGIDLSSVGPAGPLRAQIEPEAAATLYSPFVRPSVAADLEFGAFSLGIAFELTLQGVRHHYDVEEAGVREPWIRGWHAQPGLAVRACWRVSP